MIRGGNVRYPPGHSDRGAIYHPLLHGQVVYLDALVVLDAVSAGMLVRTVVAVVLAVADHGDGVAVTVVAAELAHRAVGALAAFAAGAAPFFIRLV